MKKLLMLAAAALALAACVSQPARLQTGDLIFVGIPGDYSLDEGSIGEAISASTGNGELNLIHVAIADVPADGSVWIIDATIKHGVDRHPLDTFLRDFTLKDGSLPTLIVKRLEDPAPAKEWIARATGFCGQPYDVYFLPDNGAMYCSELVRESYLDADGGYLFDEKPMNFKNSEGELPVYWEQLFARLGMDVPQDVPGTNPQDMAASPLLHTVETAF